MLTFTLPGQVATGYDVYLKINYSMKAQLPTIQPSVVSLNEPFVKTEDKSSKDHFNLTEPNSDKHDHHFGCIYEELNEQFLYEFHKYQYQLLSDE